MLALGRFGPYGVRIRGILAAGHQRLQAGIALADDEFADGVRHIGAKAFQVAFRRDPGSCAITRPMFGSMGLRAMIRSFSPWASTMAAVGSTQLSTPTSALHAHRLHARAQQQPGLARRHDGGLHLVERLVLLVPHGHRSLDQPGLHAVEPLQYGRTGAGKDGATGLLQVESLRARVETLGEGPMGPGDGQAGGQRKRQQSQRHGRPHGQRIQQPHERTSSSGTSWL